MSLVDIILKRRSIRNYRNESIPEKVLRNILEAGRMAPSANNSQPWHFVVITESKLKEKLATGRWNRFIKDSAITIVGCRDRDNEWSIVDVTIALENMVIAAEAQGVGSCWIGDFIENELKELLAIPQNLEVVALLTFGYPAEKPTSPKKKKLEEIVHYNRF